MPFLGPEAGGFLYDGSGLVGALHPALILDKMIDLCMVMVMGFGLLGFILHAMIFMPRENYDFSS